MNRIELYVDRENRLTLDFYYNINDSYPMSQFKGEKCYSIISKICEKPIKGIKENPKRDEISLLFGENVLNISECESVFKKRGTGPIKTSLVKYYEAKKAESFQSKKVNRTNKYIGRQIITGALVLGVLSTIVGIEVSRNKKIDKEDPKENTTSVVEMTEPTTSIEYEVPREVEFLVDNVSYGRPEQKQEITLENVDNKKNDLLEESSNIEIVIPYEDRSNTEKARLTKTYYGSTIEKCAKTYGIDPKIMIAIATQERGVHSGEMDRGGATGLMQLQNAVWIGKNITAYNYDLGKYETVFVDKNKLSDVFYNIKIGCMYFQNCMNYMNNNVLAAIQCYNYGYGNMQTVLDYYSFNSGKTKKEILEDVSDCGWMEYRTSLSKNEGDSIYVENVISWMGSTINFENCSVNKTSSITVTNLSPEKAKLF